MEVLLIPLFLFLVVGIPTFAIWQFIHFVVARRGPNNVSDIGTGIAWLCLGLFAQFQYFDSKDSLNFNNQLILIISGTALISIIKIRRFFSHRDKPNFFKKVFHRSLLGPIFSFIALLYSYQIIRENLEDACKTGNVRAARIWHACGNQPLSCSFISRGLDHGIHSGNIDVVNAYLAAGADPNGYIWDKSLLIKAVRCSEYAISQSLIDHGADINLTAPNYDETDSDSGKTALQIAQRQGDTRMIALLQAAGAKE